MTKYGGNVAGLFWNAGAVLLFFIGVVAASPREIISAILNIASPCTYMLFGHKNWGVALGASLGLIGTFLAVQPQILAGETSSVIGFTVFFFCIMLGIFSAPLAHRYAKSSNSFLRQTLGHPRRMAGYMGIFFTRLPIAYGSMKHGRWQLALVFAIWALGDFAYSFSRPHSKHI